MTQSTTLRELESRTVFAEWSQLHDSAARDLGRAALVRDALGLTADRLPPILGIVGSKGKGTTTIHASAVLKAAGLKVGTLQSPGAITNLDRYRIDGVRLTPKAYAEALERTDAARRTLPAPDGSYLSPTGFFTLSGIAAFAAADCDVIVAEAGLGGRSDELSLLPLTGLGMSQVFLEHTAILGDTIGQIAADKAGAAGPTTRFIDHLAQSEEAEFAIRARGAQLGATVRRIDLPTPEQSAWLPGGMNARNALLGATAANDLLSAMGLSPLDERALAQAIATVRNPGRLSTHETASGAVLVDSAVSRDGLRAAIEAAPQLIGGAPDRIIVSIGVDKDLDGFIAELAPHAHDDPERVVFIDLPGTHLHYPERGAWPYAWAGIEALGDLLTGRVLAVGTVSFTSAVLGALDVDTDRIF